VAHVLWCCLLVRLATSKASLIDNTFDWVQSDLTLLATVTKSLMAGTLTTATLTSYRYVYQACCKRGATNWVLMGG
jgi:hypothetical protein